MIPELTQSIETAHQEVLSDLERFIGYTPTRLPIQIVEDLTFNAEARYLNRYNPIQIKKRTCQWDENQVLEKEIYAIILAEKLLHEAQGAEYSRRHHFKDVLQHECLHAIFDIRYEQIIQSALLTGKLLTPEETRHIFKAIRGVDEAYAYWGGDVITGHKHLFEEDISDYEENTDADVKTLKYFYQQFHELSKARGDRFIQGNLVHLVTSNMPYVTEVILESGAQLAVNFMKARYPNWREELGPGSKL